MVTPALVHPLEFLSRLQHEEGFCGGVAETGVHHGLSAIALGQTLSLSEEMVAIDVFEDPAKNVDHSGQGDRCIFLANMEKFGIQGDVLPAIQSASTGVVPRDLLDLVGPTRLFSVDGGHTTNITDSDLHLATLTLVDGGIVLLDEWYRLDWPGVTKGYYKFMFSEGARGVVSFFTGFNKIFTTTRSHGKIYRNALSDFFSTFAEPTRVVPGHTYTVDNTPFLSVDEEWGKLAA